jgi:hypothetical protein
MVNWTISAIEAYGPNAVLSGILWVQVRRRADLTDCCQQCWCLKFQLV